MSHSLIAPSPLVWRKVYSLCLCLSGTIRGLLVSMVLISSGEMESVWQLCRVRWHWLADLTLITTTPLSITLPSLHFSPPSHPFPHKFLLPFLWLYSYFPLAISYFPCLSSICLSLTTLSFPSNVFLGISTQGFFDSGHSEEPHQKWLVSHIFTLALSSLLHCFESETVILCSFCSCPPLIPSSLAYISRQPLSLPAFPRSFPWALSC